MLGLAGLPAVGEDGLFVVEDGLKEVMLDVDSPQWLTVVLLEMPNLADGRLAVGVISASTAGARLGGAHFGAVLVLGDVGHERPLVAGEVCGRGAWGLQVRRGRLGGWRGGHRDKGKGMSAPRSARTGSWLGVIDCRI